MRDDCTFLSKAFDVLGFFHEKAFGNEQWEIGVLVTGCLDALIQATLDRFPQSESGRFENDASAHNFGVVRQVSAADDIEIPLSVVL